MATTKDVERLPSGKLKYLSFFSFSFKNPPPSPSLSLPPAVLAKKGDEVKKVTFGNPKMPIRSSNKAAKASYCARSGGIKGKDDKFSANYWSRRAWKC